MEYEDKPEAEPEKESFKIYEKEYLENPSKYKVLWIGWDADGPPYAEVELA